MGRVSEGRGRASGSSRGVILLVLVVLLLSIAVACRPDSAPLKRIQLTAPGRAQLSAPAQETRAPLRVAVAGVISPKETFKTYQELLGYLSDRLERPVELVQRQTYAEVNDLIRDGGIDLAFVCTLAYVQGQQEFGVELLAAPQVRGEPFYRSYIIVPADSPAAQLEQLREKIFAFTDPDSNTGRLVPTYLLWQNGEVADSFFRKVVYTYSHDNSIRAVADKLVDGAAVDSLVYDATTARDPELTGRIRIIYRSEPFGTPPVVVHPRLAADLKEQLRALILGLDADPAGRAILDRLFIDRFIVPDQASYEPIRTMLRKLRAER